MEDWEELNKKTYACNVCLQIFTQSWKFSDLKPNQKKYWRYTDFIYHCKEKVWSNKKTRKTFLVFCDFDCFCYSL